MIIFGILAVFSNGGKSKMSDVLEDYKKRDLDWKLSITSEGPLTYVKRQMDLRNEILFCVKVPCLCSVYGTTFVNMLPGKFS